MADRAHALTTLGTVDAMDHVVTQVTEHHTRFGKVVKRSLHYLLSLYLLTV
jgi:hypothetical protein